MRLALMFVVIFLGLPAVFAAEVDCSETYGKPSKCVQVACSEKYKSFIGTWEGPFQAFDQSINGFRPNANRISYSENDCLKNIETSDEFIIGRKIDIPDFDTLKKIF